MKTQHLAIHYILQIKTIATAYVTGFAKTRHLRTKQISEISEKQKKLVSQQITISHIYTKTNPLRTFLESFRFLACSPGELFRRIRRRVEYVQTRLCGTEQIDRFVHNWAQNLL